MKPEELIKEIIAQQGEIIGENLAMQLAIKHSGIQLTKKGSLIIVLPAKEPKEIVNDLINGYREVFGQSSVEVCLDVIRKHSTEVQTYIPDVYAGKL